MWIFNKNYSDAEIVDLISGNEKEQNIAFECLYRQNLKKAIHFVVKKGGSKELGEDLFQESLVVLYERILKGEYELRSSISTFLLTIVRNRAINTLKRDSKISLQGDSMEDGRIEMPDIQEIKERRQFVERALATLKEDCRKILKLSIYEELKMDKISELMGFENAQVARNKKSRCLKYLKESIAKILDLKIQLDELR